MNACSKTEMDAADLLKELKAQRISVGLEGNQLRVRAPSGTLTDALKARLRENRDALIALLQSEGVSAGDSTPARNRGN